MDTKLVPIWLVAKGSQVTVGYQTNKKLLEIDYVDETSYWSSFRPENSRSVEDPKPNPDDLRKRAAAERTRELMQAISMTKLF